MSIRAFPDLLKVAGAPPPGELTHPGVERKCSSTRIQTAEGKEILGNSGNRVTENNVSALPDRLQDQLSHNVH